jgi:hypothetical protein
MNNVLELQFQATKLVHWPTGQTYACDFHAKALQKIASSMKLLITVVDYVDDERQCSNCFNENSIARGDSDR